MHTNINPPAPQEKIVSQGERQVTTVALGTQEPQNTITLPPHVARRIDMMTRGMRPWLIKQVRQLYSSNSENGDWLIRYMQFAEGQNLKVSTRTTQVKHIVWMARFLGHKPFKEITKQDILDYLNSSKFKSCPECVDQFGRTISSCPKCNGIGQVERTEQDDPYEKWKGTYNTRLRTYWKFFRFLYNPDESDMSQWVTPPILKGIRFQKKKLMASVRPEDIWTPKEHALFLKYCPNIRDRCYHAMANDMSARPGEILALKIKDIQLKTSTSGTSYAQVTLNVSKTTTRTLPLIFSLSWIMEWRRVHPNAENPNNLLFVSLNPRMKGQPLSEEGLWDQYKWYKTEYFPRLLKDPAVPPEDRVAIEALLKKPWYPYILRHTALTQKAQLPGMNEAMLRDHAGWSPRSRMPEVYLHFFGTESAKRLLNAFGVETNDSIENNIAQELVRSCSNCSYPNKPTASVCIQCKFVMSVEAHREAAQEKEKLEEWKKAMEDNLAKSLISMVNSMISQGKAIPEEEAIKKILASQDKKY